MTLPDMSRARTTQLAPSVKLPTGSVPESSTTLASVGSQESPQVDVRLNDAILDPSESITLLITAVVGMSAGEITNTASVSAAAAETDVANNVASAVFVLQDDDVLPRDRRTPATYGAIRRSSLGWGGIASLIAAKPVGRRGPAIG